MDHAIRQDGARLCPDLHVVGQAAEDLQFALFHQGAAHEKGLVPRLLFRILLFLVVLLDEEGVEAVPGEGLFERLQ